MIVNSKVGGRAGGIFNFGGVEFSLLTSRSGAATFWHWSCGQPEGSVALELKRCLWQAGDVFVYRYHLLRGQIFPVSPTWQVTEIVDHQ